MVVAALLLASIGYAQPRDNDTKLAAHYFDKGQFDKAEVYYEKVYKKYNAQLYFERYFDCLLYQEKYDECEKLAEKRIKKDPYTIANQFKLAEVYNATGRENEANELYADLIKELPPIQSRVDDLGEAFESRGLYQDALETYLKGRKMMKGGYGFQLELASLYSLLERPSDMLSEYLNLLEYSPVYVKTVQTYLARIIDFEEDDKLVELLRQEILIKVQRNPEEVVFNEMFVWYYLQKEEFTGAVLQAKALDKKTSGKGRNVMDVGNVCQANGDYSAAIKAYDYVVELGDRFPYYYAAMQEKLDVEFLQVTTKKSYSKNEVKTVADDFETALIKLGKSSKTVGIMHQLAEIYAFYLDDASQALTLADEMLALPLNKYEQATVKVLKGDILVVSNEIWDASLLYMQVETAFSEDIIGHEAKYKNARVFYYDGEFEYAKAQLDVLKASTSKLIANDAMQLSLLLQDNLGIDTTTAPVQLYANADLLLQQNKYGSALAMLDSLEKRYPFHSMVDEVLFKKAEIYEKQQNWEAALSNYQIVVDSYSFDILGDDAAYRMAEIYAVRLDNQEKAAEYYKKILFDFSGSLYTADARKKYRLITAVFN